MGRTDSNGVDGNSLPQPRLLPHVVSDHAERHPQKVWAALPKVPSDASKGYQDVTFAQLNYAISRATNWLLETFHATQSRKFEALAYMGPPDSRYVIFAIAAIKAGVQMLFLSPRNSDEAQYCVLAEASCQKILCDWSMKKRVESLIRTRPKSSTLAQYTVPEQDELLKDEFVADVPYTKSIEEARQEPLVTLHTSSTTGLPKTIPLNQGYGLHEDIVQHVPTFNGLDIITRKPFYGACRMFVAMPLFHAGGVLLTLLKSLYHDIVSVFPPAIPLTAEVFDAILRHGKCNGCVIPPSLLEDMLAVPAYFDTLASLKFVQFGSGPLSKAAGDKLLTRQHDCPHYIGSSECGLYILLELDDPIQDWQYFRFHPWTGADMRITNSDENVRELFIVRGKNTVPGIQPVFELFPDLEEWSTRELYSQHPTKPDHWRFIGRADDVLVLSNGEKLNPIETENRIANAHPAVSGALVVGKGRFQPALLLEIRGVDTQDPQKRLKLIEEIWPSVERSNVEAPKHGQLIKSLILFTSPRKPFARTPKLSVRRGPTIESYAKEIDDMYDQFEANADSIEEIDLPSKTDMSSVDGIQDTLMILMTRLAGWDASPDPDEDLFMLGLDSLHVTRMVRAIKQVFKRADVSDVQERVTSQLVYHSPTIRTLSQSVYTIANAGSKSTSTALDAPREQEMEDFIEKYSRFDFDANSRSATAAGSQDGEMKVLLSGSTGSLGTYLLSTLLSDPRIAHIYCLNRSEDARQRQLDTLTSQSIHHPNFDDRVQFLPTKALSAPFLGLTEDNYGSLQEAGITHIIHNAWPVNFNLSLASFSSHLAGVRALIDFCANMAGQTRFFFVSSLSSVTSLSARMRVPEEIVFDNSAPSQMGYGESKYVAERILHEANTKLGDKPACTVLRVGQIAGPVGASTGTWPMREWLPSLVVSSKCVGALPETLGRMEKVDWIPVDLLADIMHELVIGPVEEVKDETSVYHLLNPKSVSWHDELLPTVQAAIQVETVLPLSEWIERVRQGPEATDQTRPNPARKILDFYQDLVLPSLDIDKGQLEAAPVDEVHANGNVATAEHERYKTAHSAQRSKTFREMGPVRKEWMEKWIGKWFEQ